MNKPVYTSVSLTEFNVDKNYIFLTNDAIGNTIIRDGSWEKHITELLTGYLKPDHNCLDIGANFGYHTVTMGLLTKEKGKVFAFEPMQLFFNQIKANLYLNGLTNVKIFKNAVGNKEENIFISEPNINPNHPIINHGITSITKHGTIGNKQDIVKMLTIDTISLELPKINFIKLDVQGCELLTLQGAKNKILKDNPLLVVEIEHPMLAQFGHTPEDLISFIKDELNYNIYQMVTSYPVDHLCVPKHLVPNLNFKTFYLKQI